MIFPHTLSGQLFCFIGASSILLAEADHHKGVFAHLAVGTAGGQARTKAYYSELPQLGEHCCRSALHEALPHTRGDGNAYSLMRICTC